MNTDNIHVDVTPTTALNRAVSLYGKVLVSVGLFVDTYVAHLFTHVTFSLMSYVTSHTSGQLRDANDRTWQRCSSVSTRLPKALLLVTCACKEQAQKEPAVEKPTKASSTTAASSSSSNSRSKSKSQKESKTATTTTTKTCTVESPPKSDIHQIKITFIPLVSNQSSDLLHQSTQQCLNDQIITLTASSNSKKKQEEVKKKVAAEEKLRHSVESLSRTEGAGPDEEVCVAVIGAVELKDEVTDLIAEALKQLQPRPSLIFVDHLSLNRAFTPAGMALNCADHYWHYCNCWDVDSRGINRRGDIPDLFTSQGIITLPHIPVLQKGQVINRGSGSKGASKSDPNTLQAQAGIAHMKNIVFCENGDWNGTSTVQAQMTGAKKNLLKVFPYEMGTHNRVDAVHRARFAQVTRQINELGRAGDFLARGLSVSRVPAFTRPELTVAHDKVNGKVQSVAYRHG